MKNKSRRHVNSFCFTILLALLLTNVGCMRLKQMTIGPLLSRPYPDESFSTGSQSVDSIVVSPTGRYLATLHQPEYLGGDASERGAELIAKGRIQVWRLSPIMTRRVFSVDVDKPLGSGRFEGESDELFFASIGDQLKRWGVDRDLPKRTSILSEMLHLSHDAQLSVHPPVSSDDSNEPPKLEVIRTSNGNSVCSLRDNLYRTTEEGKPYARFAFSLNDRYLARLVSVDTMAAAGGGLLNRSDPSSVPLVVWDLETGGVVGQIGHVDTLGTGNLTVSPDGRYVAVGDTLFATKTGRSIGDLASDVIDSAFSPNGRQLAYLVDSKLEIKSEHRHRLIVQDVDTGLQLLNVQESQPRSICFSNNGDRVYVGHDSGRVTVWDTPDTKPAASATATTNASPIASRTAQPNDSQTNDTTDEPEDQVVAN